MKKILTIIFSITLLFSPIFVYAQEADTNNIAVNIEQERTQQLQDELGITIPEETDNPNHIITFKDPSGKGVKLEVDGQGFKTIKSPYTLPSLGIGSHILTFRFTDKQQSSQTLDQDIVIVPRTPVITAPENISKTEVTVKGTALAGSTVEIFISGDTLNFKGSAVTNSDGTWTYTFKQSFKNAVYTVIARTKKNGFSSAMSEPIVFEISSKSNSGAQTINTIKPIYFNFMDLTLGNLVETVKSNPHLLILIVISALLGGIISWIVESLSTRKVNKTAEGKFINLLNEKEKGRVETKKNVKNDTKDSKKMTLKEKFEKAGFKIPETETPEKTLEKEEFLEAYKEQDPDNNKGVEKKNEPKSDKKKVSVSLTSKK
jgi:hypothetical protein